MLQTHTPEAPRTIPTDAKARAQRIRELNDAFRRRDDIVAPPVGKNVMTSGISALGIKAITEIDAKVMAFTEFTDANDPYGEHDFGALEFNGEKIFWKIDYYTPDLKHGSPDPADPDVTCRVLTIMLSSEY